MCGRIAEGALTTQQGRMLTCHDGGASAWVPLHEWVNRTPVV